MEDRIIVKLNQVRFFAYHGLYKEEQKTGNEFEVNLSVSYKLVAGKGITIGQTVNYVTLFELISSEMKKPRELLENFLIEVTELMHARHPLIQKVEISITKLTAPISNFSGTVGVHYSKDFSS